MACGHPEKGNGAFRSRGQGGWSLGADACPGGAGKGVINTETWSLALSRLSKREVRAARFCYGFV